MSLSKGGPLKFSHFKGFLRLKDVLMSAGRLVAEHIAQNYQVENLANCYGCNCPLSKLFA